MTGNRSVDVDHLFRLFFFFIIGLTGYPIIANNLRDIFYLECLCVCVLVSSRKAQGEEALIPALVIWDENKICVTIEQHVEFHQTETPPGDLNTPTRFDSINKFKTFCVAKDRKPDQNLQSNLNRIHWTVQSGECNLIFTWISLDTQIKVCALSIRTVNKMRRENTMQKKFDFGRSAELGLLQT